MTLRQVGAAVKRGAALLDKKEPNWYLDIDLDKLDLADGIYCVVGQLNKDYQLSDTQSGFSYDACLALGIGDFYHEDYKHNCAARHGFYVAYDSNEADDMWATLTELWTKEIQKRRNPTSS